MIRIIYQLLTQYVNKGNTVSLMRNTKTRWGQYYPILELQHIFRPAVHVQQAPPIGKKSNSSYLDLPTDMLMCPIYRQET